MQMGDQIAPSVRTRRKKRKKKIKLSNSRRHHLGQTTEVPSKMAQDPELELQVPKSDKDRATMGSRDGETELQVQSRLLF